MNMPDQTPAAGPRRRVLSMLVEDHPGVLARVSGMIRRRGFNVHGLSVGPIDSRGRSRMTLSVDAGHAEVDQIEKQLDRLIEVIDIEDLTDQPNFSRELALLKIEVPSARQADLVAAVNDQGCRVLEQGDRYVVAEFAGKFETVEEVVNLLRQFGTVEIARSGPVAISRGARTK